jgi:hypothetical protein
LKKIVKIKKCFTLIEVLVSVTIFICVIVIGSTAFSVNYIGGQPNSIRQNKINSDMQFITETIRTKADSANFKFTHGGYELKGFNATSNMISFASVGSPTQCTFIGYDGKSAMYMFQENCSGDHINVDANFKRISSADVKITGFDVSTTDNNSRLLKVIIKATDSQGSNPTEINNTYYMGIESIKGL